MAVIPAAREGRNRVVEMLAGVGEWADSSPVQRASHEPIAGAIDERLDRAAAGVAGELRREAGSTQLSSAITSTR